MASDKLTPKQQLFVREYLVDLNATQAAIRAGYSAKTSHAIGQENLRKPIIERALKLAMDARAKRVEVTADYVIQTILNTIERCSQAEPVLDKEGKPTGEYRFDASNVLKGTEQLGRHLSMFSDNLNHKHSFDEAVEQLNLARQRAHEINAAALIAQAQKEKNDGRRLQ